MDIQFDIFVVTQEKQNLLVTTEFNQAFTKYAVNNGSEIEVWKEGNHTATYSNIIEMVEAGRIMDGRTQSENNSGMKASQLKKLRERNVYV